MYSEKEHENRRLNTEGSSFSGKRSAYGSKVSYATRMLDESLKDLSPSDSVNESFYLPRLCISGLTDRAGSSLFFDGLLTALRIYFLEKDIEEARAFVREQAVFPFVLGPIVEHPDYLHFISGRRARALDPWLSEKQSLSWVLCKDASESRIALIDGGPALFESSLYGQAQMLDEGAGRSPVLASADHLVRQIQAPLLLVADAKVLRGQLPALLRGCLAYARPPMISGLLLNRIDREEYAVLREGLEKELNVPVVGFLPDDPRFARGRDWKSVLAKTSSPAEQRRMRARISEQLQLLADTLRETTDLEAILHLAERAPTLGKRIPDGLFQVQKNIGSVMRNFCLGYASDEAFFDSNAENLELLEELGAELIPVSPLADEELPENLDALYLSSTNLFPYRKALSDRRSFRKSVLYAAQKGLPVFAEGEAVLYCSRGFTIEEEGIFWPMAGLSPQRMTFSVPEEVLKGEILPPQDYVQVTNAVNNCLMGLHWSVKGTMGRHLFGCDSANAMKLRRERDRRQFHTACASANLCLLPLRLSFLDNPRLLQRFAASALSYQEERLRKERNSQTRTDFRLDEEEKG